MAGVLRPRPVPGPVPRRAPVAAQGRVSRSERLDAVQVVHGQRHGDGKNVRAATMANWFTVWKTPSKNASLRCRNASMCSCVTSAPSAPSDAMCSSPPTPFLLAERHVQPVERAHARCWLQGPRF